MVQKKSMEWLKQPARPLRRLLLQLLLLLIVYTFSRCAFTILNSSHFEGLGLGEFARLCLYGLRFDLSALLALNSVYILILLAPVPVWKWSWWESLSRWVFLVPNIAALLFEISDWAYFDYNHKRATADVLNMVGRKADFWQLLPDFLVDFWYVPLGVIFVAGILIRINRRIIRKTPLASGETPARPWAVLLLKTMVMMVAAGLTVVGIRGGLQYIPVGVRNALEVTESRYTPVVLNTPFSIMQTWQQDALEPLRFYTDKDQRAYFDPIRHYQGRTPRKLNVVVLILESFSREFTAFGPGPSYTPFLDSLAGHSLVCTQAYANALRSAEGVPAILAGVPALMEEPVITSIYGNNRLTSISGLLREQGYRTAFFHGGTNGTMGFDVFCKGVGFDAYYGRKEYNNEKDYDGSWGIWDLEFLQFTAGRLNNLPQPFFASVFTLSSHAPYKVPEKYRESLPSGSLPVHQSIAYTDMALRAFFREAAGQPWFGNTLFVLTADHSSPISSDPYYTRDMGRYAVPLLYFAPGDVALQGYYGGLTQQIDILPSVMDYLDYPAPFYAMGTSIFDTAALRYTINQVGGAYQWISGGYLLKTAGTEVRSMYAFPEDSLCRDDLYPAHQELAEEKLLPVFRAMLQEYHQGMIHNKLNID